MPLSRDGALLSLPQHLFSRSSKEEPVCPSHSLDVDDH